MNKEITMVTYSELLQKLENSGQDSHLLLGNGFNNSLGIATDYKSIFESMLNKEPVYQSIQSEIAQENYDIENLIGTLKKCLKEKWGNPAKVKFLNKYIERKVKFDFMKAASGIVRDEIKGIYRNKNQGIHLLFKRFSNYFTLNFDTFLYLLLMKFKKIENKKQRAVAFQKTLSFKQEDLNQSQNNIYNEIQKARRDGSLTIKVDDILSETDMKNLTKVEFQTIVKQHAKKQSKNWSTGDIKAACDLIWREEKKEPELDNINDGFAGDLFRNNSIDNNQNIFFLHGSFHIYKDKKLIKKITQQQNEALYDRLEELIEAEEKDIICVFASNSNEKEQQINENEYLKKCFDKLAGLSGSIVILGSSLAENDKHIFDAIDQSKIDDIYISSCKELKNKDFAKTKNLFQHKNKSITLFDYTTISYDISNQDKA